jgi:hypothetical protein
MMKKIVVTKKLTFFLLIAITGVTVLVIIWYNCNVEIGLKKEQVSIARFFKPEMLQRRTNDPDIKAMIGGIDRELETYSYAAARPRLKPAFDSFVKAWAAEGALTAKTQTAYNSVVDAEFAAEGRMKWNQLSGLLLDGAIWLFALGLALFSDILRDLVGDKTKIRPDVEPPYSLARTQLLVWVTIISSIYVYAVLWDGRDPGSLNSTALILMGISAGVFTAGAIIDTSEIQQGIPRIQDAASSGFLEDILSDSDGVSIHRFQNFAFTLVAIFVYFYRYANPVDPKDVLPILDGTLLGLTGISSATYLTMKTRENVTPPDFLSKVTIKLGVSPTTNLSPAIAGPLTNGGFPGAVVTVVDAVGNVIPVIPDPTAPNFNFIVTGLVADIYTITANWIGTVPAGAPAQTSLHKTWIGRIDKSTTSPVQILF